MEDSIIKIITTTRMSNKQARWIIMNTQINSFLIALAFFLAFMLSLIYDFLAITLISPVFYILFIILKVEQTKKIYNKVLETERKIEISKDSIFYKTEFGETKHMFKAIKKVKYGPNVLMYQTINSNMWFFTIFNKKDFIEVKEIFLNISHKA